MQLYVFQARNRIILIDFVFLLMHWIIVHNIASLFELVEVRSKIANLLYIT